MDKTHTVSKLLRLTPDVADRISRCRHASRIASEAETIRRLLAVALELVEQGRAS